MTIKEMSEHSVKEVLHSLREKPVKSTMLERIELIDKADKLVKNLPQPLKLGEGLLYVFSNCSTPVAPHDLLLGRTPEIVPSQEQEEWLSQFPQGYSDRPQWLPDGGHLTFDWQGLLSLGLGGLKQKAEASYHRYAESNQTEKAVFLQGMIKVYTAYQTYISRYGQAAKAAGKKELSEICGTISQNPPKTFYEAIQLILFIGHAFSTYTTVNSTLSYGRLDDLLLDFYLNDCKENRIDKEKAAALITDFNCKNNLILGRGEHQMGGSNETDTGWFRNPTYDTPQYIILGGYSRRHPNQNNPLTKLFLEQIIPRFENPVYVFRVTKETPDSLWGLVCDRLRGNASLLVYNDETEIPAMISAGIDPEDALEYTIHGCNWPDIPPKHAVFEEFHTMLPHRIMNALNDDSQNAEQEIRSIDDLYRRLQITFRQDIQNRIEAIRSCLETESFSSVLTCADCFYENTIEAACGICGAAKYPVLYHSIRFIATAADMMSALEQLVFIEKKYSLQEMRNALKANFEGYAQLHYDCLHCPKYGCDSEFADSHAIRLMNVVMDELKEAVAPKKGRPNVYGLNVTITDMDHIPAGKELGATPDGRKAFLPVSENLSPSAGMGQGVLTALLQSVARLPLNRVQSGALNLRLRKDWISGEEGLNLLKSVLRTYFDLGGMQVQISVADTKQLLEAQKHPENYRDLMVRITGYSAAFVDMTKHAQDELIRRDSLQ